MCGMGVGLLYISAAPLPNQWFSKRRALVMGIGASGSGVGGILFSICTNLMIEHISLAWAFLITAICTFVVNGIVIVLFRDRIRLTSAKYRSFEVSLLANWGFVAVVLWGFFICFGYVAGVYSLSDYAVSVGMTQQQGSVITGMFSAGVLFGRPAMGFLGDMIGRINLSILCTIGTSLTCFLIWMFALSYGVMIFFATIHGRVSNTVSGTESHRCLEWRVLDHGNGRHRRSPRSPGPCVGIIHIMATRDRHSAVRYSSYFCSLVHRSC